MIYEEHPPSLPLRPFVERLWVLEDEAGLPSPEPVLPDGHAEIIVHAGQPFVQVQPDGGIVRQDAVLLAGQMTRAVTLAPTGPARIVGARLRPHGAWSLFGIPQHELADRIAPLDAVHRHLARRLRDDVSGRGSRADLVRALDHALAGFAPRMPGHVPEAVAVDLAFARRGLVQVGDLARVSGVGPRQLERRFRDRVGVSPKQFLRVVRFQEVLRALRGGAPRPDWARLAAESGFYDQAHFVHDFKRFTGSTPAAWQVSDESLTAVFSALRGRRQKA